MLQRRKIQKSSSSSVSDDSAVQSPSVSPIKRRLSGIEDDKDISDLEVILLDKDDTTTTTTKDNNYNTTQNNNKKKWTELYKSPPLISRSTILIIGFVVFGLAYLWPPAILFLFYIASLFIPYAFRTNDDAVERRKQFQDFCHSKPDLPDNFRNIQKYITLTESYWQNDRGMLLCTSIMTPKDNTPIKAVACFCHGYTDHASFAKRINFQRLTKAGIAVVTIEYEGHGRSDGPLGLIPNWNTMIHDVCQFFQETVTTNHLLQNKPAFLVGESMGGAIIFDVYNKLPNFFKGCVFICPMCKIKEDMLPPRWVVDIFEVLTGPQGTKSTFGYLPIAPAKKIENLSFRLPEIGKYIRTSPTCFSGRKPRLTTARELLTTTKRISTSLSDFSAPFLVLHGKEDKVTDPELSQMLYNEAKSDDKSIRLYDGLWHNLTAGETPENVDMIFSDITSWILQRS